MIAIPVRPESSRMIPSRACWRATCSLVTRSSGPGLWLPWMENAMYRVVSSARNTGSMIASNWANPSVASCDQVRVIWPSRAAEFGRPPKSVNC